MLRRYTSTNANSHLGISLLCRVNGWLGLQAIAICRHKCTPAMYPLAWDRKGLPSLLRQMLLFPRGGLDVLVRLMDLLLCIQQGNRTSQMPIFVPYSHGNIIELRPAQKWCQLCGTRNKKDATDNRRESKHYLTVSFPKEYEMEVYIHGYRGVNNEPGSDAQRIERTTTTQLDLCYG